jgi:ribosomal protein L39E
MNKVSKANVEKKKVSKNEKQNLPVCKWIGVHVSVCVCLSALESWITFNVLNKSCRKFQEQSNSLQVIFGWGSEVPQPQPYLISKIGLSNLQKVHLKSPNHSLSKQRWYESVTVFQKWYPVGYLLIWQPCFIIIKSTNSCSTHPFYTLTIWS